MMNMDPSVLMPEATLKHDWFHCNDCGASDTSDPQPYALTQCHHVFCSLCIVQVKSTNVCPVCNMSPVTCKDITKSFLRQPQVGNYFRPPLPLMKTSSSILGFQLTQMERLIEKLTDKRDSLQAQADNVLAQAKTLAEELKKEKKIVKKVKSVNQDKCPKRILRKRSTNFNIEKSDCGSPTFRVMERFPISRGHHKGPGKILCTSKVEGSEGSLSEGLFDDSGSQWSFSPTSDNSNKEIDRSRNRPKPFFQSL